MNDHPKVSVLMPAHNAVSYVSASVSSILNQTFADFEFVIIDDASSDDTGNVIRQFKDPRIRYLRNEQNLGVALTLNIGLDASHGKYIARMDADDLAHPDRLEKQVLFMNANPAVVLCGSWARYVGVHEGHVCRTPVGSDCVKASLLFDNPIIHPTVMMRKSVIDEHSFRYDPAHSRCEDYELWIKMAEKGNMDNIPEPLLYYRIHESSVTAKTSGVMEEQTLSLSKKLLANLGIDANDEALAFHRNVGHGRRLSDRDVVSKAETWINNILYANMEKHVYSDSGLRQAASFAWFRLCMNNAGHGLGIYRTWKESSLSMDYRPCISEQVGFIFSSLYHSLFSRIMA